MVPERSTRAGIVQKSSMPAGIYDWPDNMTNPLSGVGKVLVFTQLRWGGGSFHSVEAGKVLVSLNEVWEKYLFHVKQGGLALRSVAVFHVRHHYLEFVLAWPLEQSIRHC